MSQPAQLDLPNASHRNQRLFSDYYLDHTLPAMWETLQPEASSVMLQLQQLYANFSPNPKNEAQTEDDWIKPILHALGHLFEVQVPLQVSDSVQRPDYIFYRDEAARLANKNKRIVTETDLRPRAYAIGDAKSWELSLDRARAGSSGKGNDSFTNKNPSWQIFFYMLHSGLPWGILTNGRHWRLYHIHTAHKLEIFYEVDLPALLATNDVEQFLYFYTFFRRAAFDTGPLSVEQILTSSAEYARNVSEDLRQQVYDALRYVAQGFFDYPPNQLAPTAENCKLIYDNSLTLLYRLLFILYAEARDLLPLSSNTRYQRRYSLDSIKKDIAFDLQDGFLPDTAIVWSRLQTLFSIINTGKPPLSVTTFNGGLFDPRRHHLLERHIAGDFNLCRAIDKLARVKSQFVDYRDLAERHLGTIYEGLLEYTLQVATEPMVELRHSSKIVPAAGVPQKDVAAAFSQGEVYLVTDRGERKITGSYYTPDYIVKYMVEETLRPLLEAAIKDIESDSSKIQAVLSINVLDPAMGSGHFPVEVTEYIARFLIELGVQPEETTEADMTYWKRRVAQQCIYGVDLNPLAVDLAKLSLWLATASKGRPLSFLDHHLRTGNALLGSWLSEIAANQRPGAPAARQAQQKMRKAEAQAIEAGQLPWLSDDDFRQSTALALDSIATIEQSPGATITDVKTQEAAYDELRRRFSEKYLVLADLGTAMYFDLAVENQLWRPLADYALGIALVESPEFEKVLDQASALGKQKRFFHWELEFPDIFFNHQGQPLAEKAGFDVVIGNPPYVRQEQLSADKPFFQQHYEVYHGVADLFVYFFAQGLRLLRHGGKLVYISSNTWLYANYGTPLRQYLRTQMTLETVIDLGNNYVFADAPDLSPAIQVVRKTPPPPEHLAQAALFTKGERITAFKEQLPNKLFPLSIHDQLDTGWRLSTNSSRVLLAKLMGAGQSLGNITQGGMYRGILTGLNEAFIIDQVTRDRLVKDDPACENMIKPVLRGEDLRPWYQENEGRWLICLPNGWTMQTFPALERSERQAWEKLSALHPGLAAYLTPFAEAARKRQDKGQFWWELRPCDYYDAFEQPKILWPDIGKKPRFSWAEPGIYLGNTGYCLPTASHALLGLLSSRTMWYVLSYISQPLGERAGSLIYRLIRQYMERLPIPPLTGAQDEHISNLAQQLTQKAGQRYQAQRKTTYRIENDLGNPQTKLNQRLTSWWELSFQELRAEITKVFKRDIPLKDRDDWEALLRERSREIQRLTEEIVTLETALNTAVYAVFGLNETERAIIEQETKYHYGEW